MPWFMNTETGHAWEVIDPDHVERLEKDRTYQEVEPPQPTKSSKKSDKG
ncbi:hypothetical protein SAMN06265361_10521 [Laceyella tengchongensis]|uniref:Uncharacterized protein n=1 Tax=Laceyella tengchongensis TaxID=574699 RepID=A0AA45WQI8_9BACL|nr:hypothetical protein [Laceyella tengchongensis]SMP25135.1 hypothetical protein SAMN06265361_10521 [Laceyella tengchongensis]